MKTIPKIFIFVILSLVLCSCGGGEKRMGFFEDKDKINADNRIDEIISIIREQNVNEFASIFSATAKEENDNLLSEIEDFFNIFDDTGLSYIENAGPTVYEETDSGNKSKKIVTWYEVSGENRNYIFYFVEWTLHTSDKKQVGVYTLRIIEETDFDKQFISESLMETPGVYYKPSRLKS